jgi:molybdenum cofactor guanylyltransferase
MIDRSRITGLVLSGGLGTRMEAVDKGLVPFGGRPLAVHAVARLAPQVADVLVSANRSLDRYASFGHRVVEDRVTGYAGPLAGIDAGLAACTTDHLVSVPVDAPFFPADLVASLAAAFDDDTDAAVAITKARTHPVFCLMRTAVSADLARHLAAGGRSVTGWLGGLRVRAVSFADESAFRNLNDPDALRAAEPARDE